MPNHLMKLGKGARLHDERTPLFANYVGATAPTPPASCGYSSGITSWGMMLNGPNTYGKGVPAEGLGDCTCAGVNHGLQVVSKKAQGVELTEADSVVLGLYEKWCGYVLGNANTDNGGIMLNIMKDWVAQGINGQELDAYAAVHLVTGTGTGVSVPQVDLERAIWMFGGAYVGLQMPLSAQNQTKEWTLKTGPNAVAGSWGGHAVWILGYSKNTLNCITWGQLMQMSWAFFKTYCDEAYVCVIQDWFKATGVDPLGVNLAALEADLAYVKS